MSLLFVRKEPFTAKQIVFLVSTFECVLLRQPFSLLFLFFKTNIASTYMTLVYTLAFALAVAIAIASVVGSLAGGSAGSWLCVPSRHNACFW